MTDYLLLSAVADFGARTRAELTRYAAEHGLLPPDKTPF
jgi:hypothetical protein